MGMEKRNLLITGATGFIGFHVARAFLQHGDYKVLAIVREGNLSERAQALQSRGVHLFFGYFGDSVLLSRVFRDFQIHSVIHLAALRGAGAGSPEDYVQVNVLGTEALLRVSLEHGVHKFIHCSSVGVHGTIPKILPASVSAPMVGDNAYHASKIAAESRVKEYIDKGLNAYIVRPTVTYGAGDDGFPAKLMDLLRKRILPVCDNRIHLLDVHRFAELLHLMLTGRDSSQRVFFAVDAAPVPLCELADLVHRHYFKKAYPSWMRMPAWLAVIFTRVFRLLGNEQWLTSISLVYKSYYYDGSDAIREFGFAPADTRERFLKSMSGTDRKWAEGEPAKPTA
jgi:nucleoside-diphosphate-sugar epimerase